MQATKSGEERSSAEDQRAAEQAAVAALVFDARGLLPVIVQEATTRDVLMLAWANAEAVRSTLATRRATYWSRSRSQLWVKGETSGHVQHVVSVAADCDGDTLLYTVEQTGPACHTGTQTCFTTRELS
ncbi:phosphoribosyl-AMP cyclohydrolase [Brevibacterium yomogidense]|uniref:phosphoribosyl-AMP cyclohydrolase n=1 Tax=Brevibacterium yomogidense TaxID=946573 RepID=UPI0018DFF12E